MGTLKLFYELDADHFIQSKYEHIKRVVDGEQEDYILKVEASEYADHLKNQFIVDFPEIHRDKTYVDSGEMDVPGNRFPPVFFTEPSKTYRRDTVIFYVPYSGDISLLGLKPSTYMMNIESTVEFDENEGALIFKFINFHNDPELIKREFEGHLNRIFGTYDHLQEMINNYNDSLASVIESEVDRRKQKLKSTKSFLSGLGVPIKKRNDTAETFAIPKPKTRRKIQVAKPTVSRGAFKPEPTLDDKNYYEILKIVNDVGKNFERLPSVYAGKNEEDLRDHILMVLDPNFEYGSASGETFNKSGKTDIQLRHDSSVVFVAECKFWSGEKGFHETIDQLLGYLTWRDSKTSTIIFVANKNFSSVLDTVTNSISKHLNFESRQEDSDSSWFNFTFSLPIDTDKRIKLAVQLYHLPE
ncbi:hypothetical protein [Reichenbachiella sp. MSK19-1]|uniref:hypothetical protein n=1 Tax=Reichenbachiella sp. MSK19-1 TaxID=1897631 RepID=UPI000E6CCFB3|nr:hypothetical protein [Reichenbachiella sp. MSK19-1]RJE73058.1 hypothetical protein BGP76_03705 [Reichenbachiella sp. MSK19-1]